MPRAKYAHDHYSLFFEYGVWLPGKTLDLTGDIDEQSAFKALKGLKILDSLASETPITIRLSTLGGDEYDGLTIFDAIRDCKSRVEIIGFGKVMSMGGIILQAADPDGRLLMPNSTVLVHQGTWGLPDDHPENIQRQAKEAKRLDGRINRILYERSKLTATTALTQKQFIAGIQWDMYYTPIAAISAGLADKIVEC
jgi:ATP-dependent Clp protease protease subunit